MSKKVILITLLFLSIGFASINTTMYVEGLSKVAFNTDDFKIYFSAVYLDGEDYSNQLLNGEQTILTYTTTELTTPGREQELTYEVTNSSTQYDAIVSVTCTSSISQIQVDNYMENNLISARLIKEGRSNLKVQDTITENPVITCEIEALPSEKTQLSTGSLEQQDDYVIYGNYVKSSGVTIPNANLVIYSDIPHYVTTNENGYLFYNGLEKGAHEIYHVNDTLENIKAMTKAQVISNSISNAEFTTSTTGEIVFLNSSKITNQGIMKNQSFCQTQIGNTYEFSYTGKSQTFTAMCDGEYKIELWGASGNDDYDETTVSANGGYTSGNITLNKGKKIYVYVGQEGQKTKNGTTFNNGTANIGGWCGGGATDIRLIDGAWDNEAGIKSRIMVAGAGGTGYKNITTIGAGGGLVGYSGGVVAGGTQTSFGTKESSSYLDSYFGIGNGGCTSGGGYYPASGAACASGSAGGSSFISGHAGCVAITSMQSLTPRNNSLGTQCTDGTTDITCSYHYSGFKFNNTEMIDGNGYRWTTIKGSSVVGMPKPTGTGTQTGNKGNGYAKITLISIN